MVKKKYNNKFLDIRNSLIKKLLGLARSQKTLITFLIDYCLLVLSFWVSLSIRINDIYVPISETTTLIILAPFLALPILYFFGLYRSVIRYTNYRSILTIISAISIYSLVWFMIVLLSNVVTKPVDFLMINWLVSIFLIGGIRFLARRLLIEKPNKQNNLLIYGAGNAGLQLASAMSLNPNYKVAGFIDDDLEKNGKFYNDIKVYKPSALESVLTQKSIAEILVAIPSLTRSERISLLNRLKEYKTIIRILPGLGDLAEGKISISDLKQVRIEDLLKREVREPNYQLLEEKLFGKNVMVTGGGGSIGSELCRQIILNKPSVLVILDMSEYSLYTIEKEILSLQPDCKLVTVLCDVRDKDKMKKILHSNNIDILFHTAAYKHVSLVQRNVIVASETNIFGSIACLEAAISTGVNDFIFISTDKIY